MFFPLVQTFCIFQSWKGRCLLITDWFQLD